ncbi:MAG: polysaccharide deacetylase family protein [Candidatus Yonathbacteria bacterium]|nr:polysaccharide deacetylase family protein [Candidatus Yonathbacteria bacterium]
MKSLQLSVSLTDIVCRACASFLVVGMLFAPGVFDTPVVHAASVNLVANATLETVNPSDATMPDQWQKQVTGTNTATFTYPAVGNGGSRGASVTVSSYTSGEAAWFFNDVTVIPGQKYTFTDTSLSSVQTAVYARYTKTTGEYVTKSLGTVTGGAAWKTNTWTFTAPTGVSKITVMHVLKRKGTLAVDNFSLSVIDNTAPAITITTPLGSSTQTGIVSMGGTATDAVGVASVQFYMDGVALGAPLTAAPYTISVNTTTYTNGSHVFRMDAKDAAGNTRTKSVTFKISNTVPDTTIPIAVITSPVVDATVGGTISMTGTASDNVKVTSVQFFVDGTAFGTVLSALPYSVSLNTTILNNGPHTVRMDAKDAAGNTGTASLSFSVFNDTIAPVVTITSPEIGSTLTGVVMVQGTATDDVAVASVQFLVDGNTIGSLVTTAPYTISLDTKTLTNGAHTLTMTAKDAVGNTGNNSRQFFVSNDIIAPVAAITSPALDATVSGTISIEGTATDDNAVASVQFSLDGVALGAPLTATPFVASLDTTTIANGNHTLTLTARDVAGNVGNATPVSIRVANTPSPTANLVKNPSFEDSDPIYPGTPQYWYKGSWGSNSPVFTYPIVGVNNSKAARITMAGYSSGDARWYGDALPVTGDTEYIYSEQYHSTVPTIVDAEFSFPDGSYQYVWLGSLPAAADWTAFTTTIAVPHGATGMTVYNAIDANGTLDIDDVSIVYHPTLPLEERQFSHGMVSLTFDDGWLSQYVNARPILNAANMKGGFYMITDVMDASVNPYNYMSPAQAKQLYDEGHEIGSHTLTHAHLASISTSLAQQELVGSLSDLIAKGMPLSNTLVYPYGEYNATIEQLAKDNGYIGARSVEDGYNYKDTDKFALKIKEVTRTTTLAEFQTWINEAVANKTWLVLMFHEVDAASSDPLAITSGTLQGVVNYLAANQIDVVTMRQGLLQMLP